MIASKKILAYLKETAVGKRLETISHSTKIPGFQSVSIYKVLKRIKEHVMWDDLVERASAISFNSAMALPPLLLFLCTLIPIIAHFNFIIDLNLMGQLKAFIVDVIPAKSNHDSILAFIDTIVDKPRNTLLFLGILLSLFFSSNAMMGVMRSFDQNYPGFIKRKGLKRRLIAIKITLVLVLLFILCLILLIAQKSVLSWIGIDNPILTSAWVRIRWVLILLLVFLIISYIYRHAPSVNVKWKLITPGSILATCLVVICTFCFSWWVSRFGAYNKLYGSIGTVIFMSVLIFLNALILLIGFELNASIYALAQPRAKKSVVKMKVKK